MRFPYGMKIKDQVIDWLRDAYAMERGLEVFLNKAVHEKGFHPGVREQAEKHLAETKRHAELVHDCLKHLGSDTSAIQTGTWKMLEALTGTATKFLRDERVTDALAAVASEHFEIGFYRALKVAAEQAKLDEVVETCDRIIPDEQRMLDWLDQNLPIVVQRYLSEEALAA